MRIILAGFGTVGQALTKVLRQDEQRIVQAYGFRPQLTTIIDSQGSCFDEAGLDVASSADVTVVWNYADEATAVAGLMASGPVVRAIEHGGEEAVLTATTTFLEPFRTADGGYRISNMFRYAIGRPR